MRKVVSGSALTLLVGLAAGCGGASEQRVDALEQQVKQLQAATATGPEGPTSGQLQEQLNTIQAGTTESIKSVQQSVEALQGEVSALSSKPAPQPVATGAAPWGAVADIMGVETDSVTVEGNNYTVNRGWLVRKVRALAAAGKGPKLIADKKTEGVIIRAVRPKSLPDRLGLKNNDLILAVGEQPVSTPAELYAELKAAKSPLALKIKRKRKELTLQYTLTD